MALGGGVVSDLLVDRISVSFTSYFPALIVFVVLDLSFYWYLS